MNDPRRIRYPKVKKATVRSSGVEVQTVMTRQVSLAQLQKEGGRVYNDQKGT